MNINARKGHVFGTFRIIVAILLAFLLLGLLSYMSRGVLRSNILPAYASAHHKSQLEATINSEELNVNKALQPLGLKLDKTSPAECTLDIARQWHTAVFCSGEVDAYRELTATLTDNDVSVQQADQALVSYGWHGGVDHSEAFAFQYGKKANGFDCTVQLFTDGNPNTLAARLFCSGEYYYFGNPYDHL